MSKKMLYAIMVFCLIFTMIPTGVFAATVEESDVQNSRWTYEERYVDTSYEVGYNDDSTRMVAAEIDHYRYYQVSQGSSGVEHFLYDIYRIHMEAYELQDDGRWELYKEKDVVSRDVISDITSFLL